MPTDNTAAPKLSIVVPCFNEETNVRPLVTALQEAANIAEPDYEILLVDDRSRDNTWKVICELAATNPRLRGLRHERNAGQSAALWSGLRSARGHYIATLDADLQNDPRDLPKFMEAVKNFDCVCGTRVENRAKGDNFVRVASSRIANWVRNKISGETISDAGCCYRVFKRECVAELKFFKGIHRFLPTLIKLEGYTATEIPVRHNPRFSGQSNYGVWNRLFASSYDLFAVRWMKKRMFKFKVSEQVN
jgi:glycosyltransferase involved in cell wall biosynthesis